MSEIIEIFKSEIFVQSSIRLIAAAIVGGLIGFERGRHGRAAGLRTHILVCIGAAMTSLTSIYLTTSLGYESDISRLSAQVVSGIGFLGAGTILIKNKSVITGLTTAAGMWATAAIGIALGYGFYAGAIIAMLICLFSITVLSHLERTRKYTQNLYIELSDTREVERLIEILHSVDDVLVSYDIISSKSGICGNVGVIAVINAQESAKIISDQISQIESLQFLVKDIDL